MPRVFTANVLDHQGVEDVLLRFNSLSHLHDISDPPTVFFGRPLYRSERGALETHTSDDVEEYLADAARISPVLCSTFEGLYGKILGVLGGYLKKEVHLAPKACPPGFRRFDLGDVKAFEPTPHFDTFHLLWPLLDPAYTVSRHFHLSFTLPLKLPAQGGGVHVWDISWHPEVVADLSEPYLDHRYKLGVLSVFPGLLLHRLAPAHNCESGDERITLQGFVARVNGQLYAYF